MSDGNLPISDLIWLDSRLERSGPLLLAIHPPNHLVLWNGLTGSKLWKASYDEPLLGLDLDPFSCYRLILRCQHCILLVDDFHPDKCPSSPGKRFYILAGKAGSPGRAGTPGPGIATAPGSDQGSAALLPTGKAKSTTKGTKLTKIMRQMVLGESRHGGGVMGGPAPATHSECLSAKYHRGVKDQVLVAFAKEVLLVDLVLGQTVGSVSLERAHSPLACLVPGSRAEVFYILHESGSVSVWTRKSELAVLATPGLTRSQSLIGKADLRQEIVMTVLKKT
jgi:hypothetical protein